jgi:hypothetical protein
MEGRLIYGFMLASMLLGILRLICNFESNAAIPIIACLSDSPKNTHLNHPENTWDPCHQC